MLLFDFCTIWEDVVQPIVVLASQAWGGGKGLVLQISQRRPREALKFDQESKLSFLTPKFVLFSILFCFYIFF